MKIRKRSGCRFAGRFARDENGAVAVEFALWTVMLFFVVAGGLDFGLYYIKRGQVDESLSATAISAFDTRENVAFGNLPAYARALSGDGNMSVALSCNGVAGACTNLARTCSCLNSDGGYTVQACGTLCSANGTRSGYYLTLDATSNFQSLIVPREVVGNGEIKRRMTLRLE